MPIDESAKNAISNVRQRCEIWTRKIPRVSFHVVVQQIPFFPWNWLNLEGIDHIVVTVQPVPVAQRVQRATADDVVELAGAFVKGLVWGFKIGQFFTTGTVF